MRLEHSLSWKITVGLALALPVAVGIVSPTSTIADPAAPSSMDVTFSKDIAPILQRSCQNCHRPDGVAPMALVTYEDVRPWARAIKQRTGLGPRAGVMPPRGMSRRTSGSSSFKTIPR